MLGIVNTDDDEIQLSCYALEALAQFNREKELQTSRFMELKNKAECAFEMIDFAEDWNLSQFWYDAETSQMLALEAIEQTAANSRIGCISSPSAFIALSKMECEDRKINIFEFDCRFNVFPGFQFYDYNQPLDFAPGMESSFDYLIVDPPFLSKECWLKTAETVRFLSNENTKICICTGKVMKTTILNELNCIPTKFEPKHQNGLANEFGCFTNYESIQFGK